MGHPKSSDVGPLNRVVFGSALKFQVLMGYCNYVYVSIHIQTHIGGEDLMIQRLNHKLQVFNEYMFTLHIFRI